MPIDLDKLERREGGAMIKRYDLINVPCHGGWDSYDELQEVEDGDWVRYDDHASEVERLRARVAELERDARLGAVVREVVATGGVGSDEPDQLDGYAQSLADDHSMFGAAVIRAIADALREEEAGND